MTSRNMWLIEEIWLQSGTFQKCVLRMLEKVIFDSVFIFFTYNVLSEIVQRNELISLENSTGEPKVSIIQKTRKTDILAFSHNFS